MVVLIRNCGFKLECRSTGSVYLSKIRAKMPVGSVSKYNSSFELITQRISNRKRQKGIPMSILKELSRASLFDIYRQLIFESNIDREICSKSRSRNLLRLLLLQRCFNASSAVCCSRGNLMQLALVTTDLMQSVAVLFGCCSMVDLMQSIILLGAPI